jgi:hypothetical protein
MAGTSARRAPGCASADGAVRNVRDDLPEVAGSHQVRQQHSCCEGQDAAGS